MASKIDARRTPAPTGTVYDLFGNTVTLKLTAADTGGAYSLVEYDAPPGLHGAPPHVHERTEEYIFVLDGKLNILLDGEEIVAGPGEGVLVPRGVLHSYENQSDEHTRFLTVLRPGGFEALLAEVATYIATEGRFPTEEEAVEIFAGYDFVPAEHGR